MSDLLFLVVGPSAGLDDFAVRCTPEGFHAVEGLDELLAILKGHTEQAGGEAVGCAGVGGEDAHADEGALQAPGLSGLCHHLHGVALAHTAHVEGHIRVGEVDGLGVFVDDEVGDVAVPGGGIQCLLKQRACLSILRMGGFFCVSFDREGGKWYDSGIPKGKTARMGNAEPPESVADGYDEQQRAV